MTPRVARQWLLIALSLALFAAQGHARVVAWFACYLAGWLALEVGPLRQLLDRSSPRALAWIGVALAVPGVAFAYRARSNLADAEEWSGLATRVEDRFRLERTPSIAPGLVVSDRPQAFFIHAPGGKVVELELPAGGPRLPAEALGEGLFRVDYDPRRDGLPKVRDGSLNVQLRVDGHAHRRALVYAAPLAHPREFCASPSASSLASASLETDELMVVGTGELRRIPVGDGPEACAFIDESHVAVSHRFAASLWVISLAGDVAPRRVQFEAPLGKLVFDAGASELVIAALGRSPALLRIAWPELTQRPALPLSAAADQLLLGAQPGQLLVATRVDPSLRLLTRRDDALVPTQHLALTRPAAAAARSRDGSRVFLATTDYRADGSPQLGNHFVQDQLLVVNAGNLAVERRLLTARRSESQTKPGDVDQGGSPMGMCELASGALAIVFAGTGELWRLDWSTEEPHAVALDSDALFTPHGVAELNDGTLWISSAAAGTLGRLAPRAPSPAIIRLTPDDRELLAQNEVAFARRLGERGFYETTRSGIACQSCHMHADSDAAAYNLGDHRPVPTLSVHGLLGTAPYLRDGTYPRIEDLDSLAQTLYRGYARVQPARRVALSRFVEALPRDQPQRYLDRGSERRGLQVFMQAGCARCHSFPAFTNLAQLPMAALFPRAAAQFAADETVDVPSLLSVGLSAPYLNDGRAATLAAVLDDENPDDLHGKTRGLSPAERSDLIAFLSSL